MRPGPLHCNSALASHGVLFRAVVPFVLNRLQPSEAQIIEQKRRDMRKTETELRTEEQNMEQNYAVRADKQTLVHPSLCVVQRYLQFIEASIDDSAVAPMKEEWRQNS